MQYVKSFYGQSRKQVIKSLKNAFAKETSSAEAKYREKVILFYQKNGLKLTQEAFEVKRSTLYRWQKEYVNYGLRALENGDKRPKRLRQSAISQEIKDYIKAYRLKYGKIHQDEIKPHLDLYCKRQGIKSTSISSIGRIIRALKDKGELSDGVKYKLLGKTGGLIEVKNKNKKKERRSGYLPDIPGDLLQVDSMHLNIYGKKRYLISAIDLKSRFAFSYGYERLNSVNATDFFKRLKENCPFAINRIQTDNGSEFDGCAHDYLKKENLTHFYNYPRKPKSNAYIERFNRTLKEQFVYRNEDCMENCKIANEQ
ncbi:MAG: DDE-type integrase/transposase/recombinase, partial [Endomicrobia bacterium]|nr:DDE-type integrase/transposase/recombinase [Endomicrobiia bacterium]